jgi:hypothetical protein
MSARGLVPLALAVGLGVANGQNTRRSIYAASYETNTNIKAMLSSTQLFKNARQKRYANGSKQELAD